VSYNPIINNYYPSPAAFGSGADGNVIISSNTSLTRDMHYDNLTINSGFTLNPSSWRIFVRNTLTINGAIAINGNSSANDSPTGGTAVGSPGAFLGTSGAGGAGSTGNGIAAGAVSRSAGGMGGAGGNNAANTGGAGGTLTTIPTGDGGFNFFRALPTGPLWGRFATATGAVINGGSGGGGGAGNGAPSGTGGGGGGGIIVLCAKKIVSNTGGSISANGGNSGNATVTNRSTGGGGGGGLIYIATSSLLAANITVTASGGIAGSIIGGTGIQGSNGASGNILYELFRSINS
jgi:hypothetical protein